MRSVCALIVAATAVILGLRAGVVAAESSNGAGVVTALSGPVTVSRQEALPRLLRFRDPLCAKAPVLEVCQLDRSVRGLVVRLSR